MCAVDMGPTCVVPTPSAHGNGVDLKRVPPKSRPAATAPGPILGSIPRWKRPARTPPSTFLFLPIHLSNSPGPLRIPSPRTSRRAAEATAPDITSRRLVTVISEELRRRAIAPSSGAPCGGYIGRGPEPCQHFLIRFCHPTNLCMSWMATTGDGSRRAPARASPARNGGLPYSSHNLRPC
jgi:hypothetical protein